MQTFHIILLVIATITLGLIVFLEINRRKAQKEERSWMDIKHEIKNDPLEIDGEVINEYVPETGESIESVTEYVKVDNETESYHSESFDNNEYDEPNYESEHIIDNADEEALVLEDIEVEPNKLPEDDLIKNDDSEGQSEFNFAGADDTESELTDEIVLKTEDEDYDYDEDEDKSQSTVTGNDSSINQEEFHSKYEEVFALSVMAQGDDLFEGADLIREFTAQNLQFGDMEFYHRAMPGMRNINLFSVANIMQPGKFAPKDMLNLKTKGLLLFMQLPGKLEPIQAFDQFYDTADALAITLGGIVCDEHRNTLSRHRLGQIRDKIRHLDLKLELERKKASKNH